MAHKGRIVDAQLAALLQVVRFDIEPESRELAKVAPNLLLEGEVPVLLDEWQTVPELWSRIKVEVDTRQLPGQFILTGPSIPVDDLTRDTGAGRLARLKMRP